MSVDHYTYRVTWSTEDNEHVGLCAEFPSLSWLAKTPEAALKGIRRVVADTVADMQAAGEEGWPCGTMLVVAALVFLAFVVMPYMLGA